MRASDDCYVAKLHDQFIINDGLDMKSGMTSKNDFWRHGGNGHVA